MVPLPVRVFLLAQLATASNLRASNVGQEVHLDVARSSFEASDEPQVVAGPSSLEELSSFPDQAQSLSQRLHDKALSYLQQRAPALARSAESFEQTARSTAEKAQRQGGGLALLLEIALVATFAYFYLQNRELPGYNPKGESPDLQDWSSHWYDCFSNMEFCLMGCCCPCIRWAETISLVKNMLPFWTAFLIFFLLMLVSEIPSIGIFGQIAMVVVLVSYRQQLRESLNFREQGGNTMFTDCLLYCFCMPCTVIQEAKHVELALQQGHPQVFAPEDRKVMSSVGNPGYEPEI